MDRVMSVFWDEFTFKFSILDWEFLINLAQGAWETFISIEVIDEEDDNILVQISLIGEPEDFRSLSPPTHTFFSLY